MSTPFAALEARLGRATQARLANATASFNGGTAVAGMFNAAASASSVGTAGAYGRAVSFTCAVGDVVGITREGTTVVVSHPAATAPWYTIKSREPDDLHAGSVTFLLERPA